MSRCIGSVHDLLSATVLRPTIENNILEPVGSLSFILINIHMDQNYRALEGFNPFNQRHPMLNGNRLDLYHSM